MQYDTLIESLGPGTSLAGLKSPFYCWLSQQSDLGQVTWSLCTSTSMSLIIIDFIRSNKTTHVAYLTYYWSHRKSFCVWRVVMDSHSHRELQHLVVARKKAGSPSQLLIKRKLSRMSKEIKINFLLRFFFLSWWHSAVIRDSQGITKIREESSTPGTQIITRLFKDMIPL